MLGEMADAERRRVRARDAIFTWNRERAKWKPEYRNLRIRDLLLDAPGNLVSEYEAACAAVMHPPESP